MSDHPSDFPFPALSAWLAAERVLGVPGYPTAPAPPVAAPTVAEHDVRPARATAVEKAIPAARPAPAESAAELPALCDRDLREPDAAAQLAVLDEQHVRSCIRCGLHAGRTQTVFGVGRARPELVFVGEGPGADEDAQGQPFVGLAGKLLTRMIAAMTLTREQVYICNVVKCRPPQNRTPSEEEMRACSPFLWRQLALLRPRVIVALGRPAAQTLLATSVPISRLRGEFHDFPPPALSHLGLPPSKVMPTYHPAYLLREPDQKAKVWDDLKQVMRWLGMPIPAAR